MKIPNKLKNFNFVLLGGDDGKKPFEKAWQKKIYRIDDEKLQTHLKKGGNYGVQSNGSVITIKGNPYFLVIIDFDTKEFQDKVIKQFPDTFTTTSGSDKNCVHLWFASDNNKSFKILDEKLNTLADIIGEGKQVVAPGSKHIKSGNTYSVVKDNPITFIPYSQIQGILMPYDKTPKKVLKPTKQYSPRGLDDEIISKILNSISMTDILKELRIDTNKNPTNCFGHSSKGGKCFSWTNDTAHCFHCQSDREGWNRYTLIREAKKLTDKETFEWFAEKAGMLDELKQSRKNFVKKQKPEGIFTPKGQAEYYTEARPLFYDKSRNWWLWNKELFKWELVDEVDILNMISDSTGVDIINSKTRNEILNSLKQEGRKRIPKPIKKTWIQFKDKIIDFKTGEIIKAAPEYFITNPIPWKIHNNNYEATPIIDRIFEEWVGKDYIQTLHEIVAYCLIPDYPIHRLFCLIGEGMNGKSCFLRLLTKFIGEDNVTATELDTLISSRFEITRLHKKLVCIMGETNFAELSKTSIIKKLTGQDVIGFEYKNRDLFEDNNYAKIMIATNNLPTTTDKTLGFYRRWCIVDFPNRFTEEKDILDDIPEEEYEALALRSLGILKDLMIKRKFHNEGNLEQRQEKYEAKSDFLQKFIDDFIDEDLDSYITKADFFRKFSEWCIENRHRHMSETSLGLKMKERGIESGKKHFEWLHDGKGGQARIWLGIRWKNL